MYKIWFPFYFFEKISVMDSYFIHRYICLFVSSICMSGHFFICSSCELRYAFVDMLKHDKLF